MVEEPKVDSKDIKPEAEQQDDVARVKAMLKEYGQTAIIGIGIALAIILGLGAYRNHKASANEAASQMLLSARTPEELQQVVNQYEATPTAPLAMLTLGARYFDSGQYDLARVAYAQFAEKYPEHPMKDVAALGSAQCFEAEGQLEQALDGFTAFAAAHTNHFLLPLAIFGKARCLTQLGRFPEARVEYEDFMARNPESGWVPLAESALLFVDKEMRAKERGLVDTPAPISFTPAMPALAPVGMEPDLVGGQMPAAEAMDVPATDATVPAQPLPENPEAPAETEPAR